MPARSLSVIRHVAVPLVAVMVAALPAATGSAATGSAATGSATAQPGPGAATSRPGLIVLPDATSAEGIAVGRGGTFYAGDLLAGDIFRGSFHRRTAELFIDAPAGRNAVGMAVDVRNDLLFVAGGFTGQAYVYDTRTGATVTTYQFGEPNATMINDVAVTDRGAWFTNSFAAELYFVPVDRGRPAQAFRTLELSGPAADTSGEFNNNGIQAAFGGRRLIVAHSAAGVLNTVNPADGTSATIAGVSVPGADGIVLAGNRLWAVQGGSNQVSRVRLSPRLTSGVVEKVITSDLFQTPSTAARHDGRLGVINAKFDTGFPPTADQYEVVIVDD